MCVYLGGRERGSANRTTYPTPESSIAILLVYVSTALATAVPGTHGQAIIEAPSLEVFYVLRPRLTGTSSERGSVVCVGQNADVSPSSFVQTVAETARDARQVRGVPKIVRLTLKDCLQCALSGRMSNTERSIFLPACVVCALWRLEPIS